MPLHLVQTVAPVIDPVSLIEVKQHLRITHDDEDALLAFYVLAAQEYAERTTRRQLLTATYTLGLNAFPACRMLPLPRPPLQSVTSVTYLDTSGASQTLATTGYSVVTTSEPGYLALKYSQSWPSTYSQAQAITITYVAGWASYSAVPSLLKMALFLLVGHFYEHREATIEKALQMIPYGVNNLLWLHRAEVI